MEVLELLSLFGPRNNKPDIDMLDKCIMSGWESLYCSVFLGDKLFSCTVYMLLITHAVMQEDLAYLARRTISLSALRSHALLNAELMSSGATMTVFLSSL